MNDGNRANLTRELLKKFFGIEATPEQLEQILEAAGEDSSNIYYEDLDRKAQKNLKEEVLKLTQDDPFRPFVPVILFVEDEEEPDLDTDPLGKV